MPGLLKGARAKKKGDDDDAPALEGTEEVVCEDAETGSELETGTGGRESKNDLCSSYKWWRIKWNELIECKLTNSLSTAHWASWVHGVWRQRVVSEIWQKGNWALLLWIVCNLISWCCLRLKCNFQLWFIIYNLISPCPTRERFKQMIYLVCLFFLSCRMYQDKLASLKRQLQQLQEGDLDWNLHDFMNI